MQNFTSFSAPDPWPPVRVERPNPRYAAEMLSNIGACDSEMTAAALYFYNSTVLSDAEPEFSGIFHRISIVEMRHLEIFARLAHLLGADPRLWSFHNDRLCYWSPACSRYPTQMTALLQNALALEQETILKYRQQAARICDACLADLLNRVILDEQLHLEIFRQMLAEVCPKGP